MLLTLPGGGYSLGARQDKLEEEEEEEEEKEEEEEGKKYRNRW